MGLDVYLYKQRDDMTAEEFGAASEAYEAEVNAYWELEDEEREKATKPDDDPENACEQIELSSEKYPDHMFKIGYFRSSYNSGGLNSILRASGLMDLYGIFPQDEGEYIFRPDWAESLKRAQDALAQYETEMEDGRVCYRAESFSAFMLRPQDGVPSDCATALGYFMKEKELHDNRENMFGGSYSNARGTFFMEKPLEVMALMPGNELGDRPSLYAVFRIHEDTLQHYRQSLEIVVETIEWVLAQDDPTLFYFHWSA